MTTVTVRTDSGKTIETILIGKEHIEDEHANDYILNLIDLAIRNGCTIDQKERTASHHPASLHRADAEAAYYRMMHEETKRKLDEEKE